MKRTLSIMYRVIEFYVRTRVATHWPRAPRRLRGNSAGPHPRLIPRIVLVSSRGGPVGATAQAAGFVHLATWLLRQLRHWQQPIAVPRFLDSDARTRFVIVFVIS